MGPGPPSLPKQTKRVWRPHAGRYAFFGALVGFGIVAGLMTFRFAGSRGKMPYKTITIVIGFLLFGGEIGRRIGRMQGRMERLEKTSRGLKSLCQTDTLTGVLSRMALLEQLEVEIRRARRYGSSMACLFIDVDDFKRQNDQHGHLFGDRSLVAIARTMARNIRETDVLGRYGGDEFLILLPQTGLTQAYQMAERVRNGVSSLDLGEGTQGDLTVSVGVYVSGRGEKTGSDCLQWADESLRQSKHNGKNRTVVFEHPEYAEAGHDLAVGIPPA